MSELLIETRKISKSFGGVKAVRDVTFSLKAGDIIGLIGPNGAGKTTLVNLLTGVLTPDAGEIIYKGENVTSQRPFQAARRGISRTFQIVQPSGAAKKISHAQEIAFEHLKFVGLEALVNRSAQTLTLPSRKRLELAKSLAMNPSLLLLDEVNAGLNTGEVEQALDMIRAIAARGITIVIIEHLMKVVLSLSHRIMVLHHGELISEGTAKEVVNDPKGIEAYLGSKFSEKQIFLESFTRV